MTFTGPPADLSGFDVLAAGAVLWRTGPAGVQLAVVHRPRYDDWSLPKGKLERGESMPGAAVREVAEETGYRCRLGARVGDARYRVPEGNKLVRYWAAETRSGDFTANHETDRLRWVDPATAAGLLTYRHDRALLDRFAAVAPPHSVLLLVRHARAGSREQWAGADPDRPLSGAGRQQAGRLGRLLTLFGPDRLASAPPLRCRQSVQPLADRLGLPIAEEPLLGEAGYAEQPGAALDRLCRIAAEPGVTVLSSQGGVIPHLVGELLSRPPEDVPSRKASTWALTFGRGGLLAADYYPEPTGD